MFCWVSGDVVQSDFQTACSFLWNKMTVCEMRYPQLSYILRFHVKENILTHFFHLSICLKKDAGLESVLEIKLR